MRGGAGRSVPPPDARAPGTTTQGPPSQILPRTLGRSRPVRESADADRYRFLCRARGVSRGLPRWSMPWPPRRRTTRRTGSSGRARSTLSQKDGQGMIAWHILAMANRSLAWLRWIWRSSIRVSRPPRIRGPSLWDELCPQGRGVHARGHGRAARAGPYESRVASAAVCVTTCKRAVFLLRQRVLAPESERSARALAVARAAGADEIHAAG
jgi:hypothetical protein